MRRSQVIKQHDVRDQFDTSPERVNEIITEFEKEKLAKRQVKIAALLLDNATKKISLDVRKGEPSFFKVVI
jgi:hypothetical protein